MIEKIKIKNMYSFKKINLNLDKINLISGDIGSGKSNLINIFAFLKKFWISKKIKSEKIDYEPYIFQKNAENSESEIECIIEIGNIKYKYELKMIKSKVLYESLSFFTTKTRTKLIVKREYKNSKTEFNIGEIVKKRRSIKRLFEINCLDNMSIISIFGITNTNIEYGNLFYDYAYNKIFYFNSENSLDIIKKFLKNKKNKFEYKDIKNIIMNNFGDIFTFHEKEGNIYLLNIRDESKNTIKNIALKIILENINRSNSLLLIDDNVLNNIDSMNLPPNIEQVIFTALYENKKINNFKIQKTFDVSELIK